MSSKEKERVIEEMWQKEKIFDELLALILQGISFFFMLYCSCKALALCCVYSCIAVCTVALNVCVVPDTSNELTLESIYVTTVRMISPSPLPPDTK